MVFNQQFPKVGNMPPINPVSLPKAGANIGVKQLGPSVLRDFKAKNLNNSVTGVRPSFQQK